MMINAINYFYNVTFIYLLIVEYFICEAEDGERTVGGNGLGRFNSTALRRMIEYKWMPTPGLRQGFEPNSNLLGQQGMEKPN